MNSVPLVPLGAVAVPSQRPVAVVPGQSYRTLGVKWWGEGAYERDTIDGSQTAAATLYEVQEDDLIINKIWVRHGSVAIAGPEIHGCAGSNEFPTFMLNRAKVLPRWIHWYTKTRDLWQKCDALSQGTSGKNRIRPERFLTIKIPLPSLPEQRRIVAKVEELAAKVEEARGLRGEGIEETDVLHRSQVGAVYDSLLSHGRRSFGSFEPHVTSGPRSWGKHYTSAGLRFYRAQDIGPNGEILEGAKAFVDPPDGEQGRSAFLAPGDLLIVITGATVGRCSVFTDNHEPGLVSQHVAICRLPNAEVDPAFVLWGLRSPQGQEQLLGQRYGQGKPGLNLTNIRRIELPFPPLSDQRRIVAYLDDLEARVDSLKALQAKTAAELDALLPSILDKAFKGEL